jgi:uncharacterized protein (DUF1330 family)
MNGKVAGNSYIWKHPVQAYIVLIREKTLDESELEAYQSKARPTLGGRPIKVLSSNVRHMTFEGPEATGVVVAELPSLKDARAYYESPAHQEAAQRQSDSWLADMEYCDRF